MTGQSLLDRMEVLNRELQLQSGETSIAKALVALNMAQDFFETLAALQPRIYGSATGTVTTTANTETTTYPTALLRIDKLQMLDPNTSRPTHDIDLLTEAGSHLPNYGWPVYIAITAGGSGEPREAWVDGTNIYWSPLPNATHTARWYGFQRASDITAAGTFAYEDGVSLPLCTMAVELIRRGLDDPVDEYMTLADTIFSSTLKQMKRFRRAGPLGRQYRFAHDT